MMSAVGNEETVADAIRQDLTGEEERTVAAFPEAGQIEAYRLLVERSLGPVIFDQLGNAVIHGFAQTFARAVADEVTLRIDQVKRRPRVYAVRLPDLHIGVVDHGVTDLITQNRLADAVRIFLIIKLGRVHSDHDELIGILLFQPGQVRERVDAVDAAERPEVQKDDFSTDVAKPDGPGSVEPGHTAFQLRGKGPLFFVTIFSLVRRR